jgi:hypothetical protein
MKCTMDCDKLPENYQKFYHSIRQFIHDSRIFCGPFETLQYSIDASFYRLLPKIVVKAWTPEEVARILKVTTELRVPVTFRTAGTSLSGQAQSDSVLIYLAGAWQKGSAESPATEYRSGTDGCPRPRCRLMQERAFRTAARAKSSCRFTAGYRINRLYIL